MNASTDQQLSLSYDHEKGLAKGSARSIEGFDLFKNLSTCRELLPHFGGHPMAAGMTLNIEDVPELRSRLNQLADRTANIQKILFQSRILMEW